MAITDGTEYEHHDPRKKKDTEYDQVWNALEGSGLKMMGDHAHMAQAYDLRDPNNIKVGVVNFDGSNSLLGATFYGEPYVLGKTKGRREAFYDLLRRIEETHGK